MFLNTKMGKKKKLNKSTKQKAEKTFEAQVNCRCNRRCADRVDVLAQKDIFENYHGLKSWSEKTKFLRSIVKRDPVKDNESNVRVNLKKRDYFSSYFLTVEDGAPQRVCSAFLVGLLQVNRTKIFRAVSSITKNPNAADGRGKTGGRKINPEDMAFMVEFIQSLPQYESKIKPNSSAIKYFHPNLTVHKVFQLYENACRFKERFSFSKSFFVNVLKKRFSYLLQFKKSKDCRQCKSFNEQKKRQILSESQREKNQKDQDDHNAKIKTIKSELLQCVAPSSEETTEVFSFELQRPLEMPFVPIDESYDWRPLWFSNLCVYDEEKKRGYMYVWDEAIAERGPEQVASCLVKHIYTTISESTKKVILYSKSSSLYRNIKISLMLKFFFDYRGSSNLIEIEQRFFLEGHDSNDCNRCFESIEKEINIHQKKEENVYAPSEWIELIASAKQTEPRFDVTNMTVNDFFSVKQLLSLLISEKHSANGEEIFWRKVSNITYASNEPLNLCVRYTSDETAVFLLSHQESDEFRRTKLVYSNKEGNKISKAKFNNLQMNLKYVPTGCHEYFKSVKFEDNNLDKDFALASYSSDEESM